MRSTRARVELSVGMADMHAKAMAGHQNAIVLDSFLTKPRDTPFSKAKSDSQLAGKLSSHIARYGKAEYPPLYVTDIMNDLSILRKEEIKIRILVLQHRRRERER